MRNQGLSRDSPPLRPYQQEALDKMKTYDGHSALLVLGTGLGKTRIFSDYLRWDVLQNDHTALILSHREELVMQPLSYLNDLPCGVELATQHPRLGRDKIVSASVQSIVNRLERYNPREIDTIIVDEAHHVAAPTYRKVLNYFPSAQVFGFTATTHRGDGIGLGCEFDDLLFERTILWGIQNGYLVPIEAIQARLKYDMGSVRIVPDTGDFNEADLASALSGTALGVAEIYNQYAVGQTIIFAVSVREAQDIANVINEKAGSEVAACITAETKRRTEILNAYTQKRIRVLVNFNVLTEGVDLPATETILIARPVAHTNTALYAQMVGRGLRLYPQKEKCRVIDCIGISDSPLCTAATLIGKDVPSVQKRQKEEKTDNGIPKDQPALLSSHEVPTTWIRQTKEVKVMDKEIGVDTHGVAWMKLQNGGYVLPLSGLVYRISAPLSDGTVYLWRNRKSSKKPMPLQFVFDYVFIDLQKKHQQFRHIWDKERRKYWDKNAATQAQMLLIQKLAPDYHIDAEHFTRGDASALIQYLIYEKGGKG